ncbi:tripartite tricarboxylate transporter TctB family protein [Vibrio hyugaensis]|uniref:DUF1468 domain-containing protein n=2 Tax=Vibrio hyugaensis TaxID=1534743 RepID=A0ABQ5XZL4_9VIBR|nr:hypothetical protein GCM10007906_03490 [Vibrio hyugaensis]
MSQNSLQQKGSQPTISDNNQVPKNNHSSSNASTLSLFDRDIIFPCLMIVISAIILVIISQFDKPHFQDASVNAQFFPSVIAIAQIIICIALIAQRKLKAPLKTNSLPLFSKMAVFGIGFLIAYAVLINLVGYLIASLIAFTVYLMCFKVKKPLYYLIAWVFVFGVYYLFGEVFYISLPQGLFY